MIQLVPAKTLIAKLTPMRPILCLVAVGGADESVGFALTDSYLGSASPLPHYAAAASTTTKSANDDFQRAVRLHKPGGVAFALPMKDRNNDQYPESATIDCELVLDQRAALLRHLQDLPLTESMNDPILMACFIDERLTVDEAWQVAQHEVEQWEDCMDLLQDRRRQATPPNLSLDAAVALNQFLWTHTGGWRNTFG
jgi:RNase H-fold protein (predicted Holliday junction resolvase)